MFNKDRLTGLFSMSIGIVVVLGSLLVMNEVIHKKDSDGSKTITAFDVKNPNKNKKKKKLAVKKKIRKKKAKVAPPKLGSSLTGKSFGLNAFELLGEGADGIMGGDNLVMTEDTVDILPKPTYRPPLEYPSGARNKGISGHVVFNLLVNGEGNIEQVSMLESEPAGVFDQVATDSVWKWQFSPAKFKGKEVAIWVKQRISFNLN
jgi:protein TonB